MSYEQEGNDIIEEERRQAELKAKHRHELLISLAKVDWPWITIFSIILALVAMAVALPIINMYAYEELRECQMHHDIYHPHAEYEQ